VALWIPEALCGNHGVRSFLPPLRSFVSLSRFISTVFWAGDIFAPKLHVKDRRNQAVPIQQFLQTAFLDMWEKVVQAVGDLDGVVGFQVRVR
jgi:hypothetical protein